MSVDDWVCIFVLFVVQMGHPTQGAPGGWVMPDLVFKWFHLCEFSLFDTPYGQFSGNLGCWSQVTKWFVMALTEIKTSIQKQESKDEPQTNGSYKIRQIIIKIMEQIAIYIHP